jgi:hypothetical protein
MKEIKYGEHLIRYHNDFCSDWCTALAGNDTSFPHCTLFKCSLIGTNVIYRDKKCIFNCTKNKL